MFSSKKCIKGNKQPLKITVPFDIKLSMSAAFHLPTTHSTDHNKLIFNEESVKKQMHLSTETKKKGKWSKFNENIKKLLTIKLTKGKHHVKSSLLVVEFQVECKH